MTASRFLRSWATLIELQDQFQAISVETQATQGTWLYEGHVYRDDLVRIYVDVAPSEDITKFFVAYKEQLKRRFQQVDIRITTYLIDVI